MISYNRNECISLSDDEEETSSDDESDSQDPDYCYAGPSRTRKRNSSVSFRTSMEIEQPAVNSCILSLNGSFKRRRGRPPKKRVAINVGTQEDFCSQDQERPRTRRKLAPSQPPCIERTILSWLIDIGEVIADEKIQYVSRKNDGNSEVLKDGRARIDGVLCECCQEIMTVWEFEAHALSAGSNLRMAYDNIVVARTSKCLLQCQTDAWNGEEEVERRNFNNYEPGNGATDRSDDACLICADGGDLLCCEKCPSTFHPSCMGMESVPAGDWLCPYCVCKHCGGGSGDLLTCCQCEKKYHWHCFLERTDFGLNSTTTGSFCDSSCGEVYDKLQSLIGVKHEIEEGFCWTLLRRMEKGESYYDMERMRTECNSKIVVAWQVMNECFRRNIDRHTRINVLQSVIYNRGSNLMRINYQRFYTAILEKNDKIVSAASIRIHGTELAEMPFIATRHQYRKRGMSKMLFVAIESILATLKVNQLVIPSVPELVDMWLGKYGLSIIDERLKQKLSNFNTLMFPSTVRLEKTFIGTSGSSSADMDIDEIAENYAKLTILDLNFNPPLPNNDEVVRPSYLME